MQKIENWGRLLARGVGKVQVPAVASLSSAGLLERETI